MVLISVIREVDYVTDFEILVVLIVIINFLFIDGTLLIFSGIFIMQKVDIRDLNLDLFLLLICDFLEELANDNFFDLYSWWQVINNIIEIHVEYTSDLTFGYHQLFDTFLFGYNRCWFRCGTFYLRWLDSWSGRSFRSDSLTHRSFYCSRLTLSVHRHAATFGTPSSCWWLVIILIVYRLTLVPVASIVGLILIRLWINTVNARLWNLRWFFANICADISDDLGIGSTAAPLFLLAVHIIVCAIWSSASRFSLLCGLGLWLFHCPSDTSLFLRRRKVILRISLWTSSLLQGRRWFRIFTRIFNLGGTFTTPRILWIFI